MKSFYIFLVLTGFLCNCSAIKVKMSDLFESIKTTTGLPSTAEFIMPNGNFSYVPSQEELGAIHAGLTKNVAVIFPYCEKNFTSLDISSTDKTIAKVVNVTIEHPIKGDDSKPCFTAKIIIKGIRLGHASLVVQVIYPGDVVEDADPCIKTIEKKEEYALAILRMPSIQDQIFRFVVIIGLVILNFGFGCALNMDVVKEILKKPYIPLTGFACQYVMMPLLGFGISKTLLKGYPLFGFGLLCSSCSPGGAGSNVWCLLLGGDVSLSLTMTFFSLSASLAMMPLWIFMLSRFYIDPSQVKVPYLNILVNLTFFVVPCFIGCIVRKIKQPLAERLSKLIKPLSLIFVVFLLTFGLWVNRYIYGALGQYPFILFPALLQPYLGFAFGFLVAKFLARLPRYRALTVAIETGVQNVTIPMVMLQHSFPQPYGDIAAVLPVTTAHFTPLPLLFSFIGLTIYNKFFRKDLPFENVEDDTKEKIPDEDNDVTKTEITKDTQEKEALLNSDENHETSFTDKPYISYDSREQNGGSHVLDSSFRNTSSPLPPYPNGGKISRRMSETSQPVTDTLDRESTI